ncbi:MAG: hypothetical protein AB1489_04790 [Acidobacteriota bacterium]
MKASMGFSLLEVIIAILIMTTGLVALAGTLVVGVTLPQRARKQEIAKQLANTIMESIIAAKESSPPGFDTFDSLSYRTSIPPGRFLQGETDMLIAGPDGVYGTCDDGRTDAFNINCPGLGTNVMRIEPDPGPDGIYDNTSTGRTDNPTIALFDFRREVFIRDPEPGYKEIEVRVYYTTPTKSRETVSLICRLANFRRL